jgi:glutamine amidotransferase
MSLAIIDSGGANIASIRYALQRLGAEPVFTADRDLIESADRVILPGVGSAAAAMQHLEKHRLVDCIRGLKQPVLGICLGMQLLFERSAEGPVDCLGLIPGNLARLQGGKGVRVPHMGWNHTRNERADPMLEGLDGKPWFYFVHSYAAPVSGATLASCRHGESFSAMVRKDNFMGAQFHPERSAAAGARVLKNFLELPCN